jgi:hypothetical protein
MPERGLRLFRHPFMRFVVGIVLGVGLLVTGAVQWQETAESASGLVVFALGALLIAGALWTAAQAFSREE